MKQMHYAKKPVREIEGVLFSKVLGTGGRGGFSFIPDFGTYAVLAVWDSFAHAKAGLSKAIYREYEKTSAHHVHFFLSPLLAKGSWAGFSEFRPNTPVEGIPAIAVITRAKIRSRYLPAFWSLAPRVSRTHKQATGKLFSKGVGEYPLIEQATFTIWESLDTMMAFTRSHTHKQAVQSSYRENGFSEYLFARFQPVGYRGKWIQAVDLPLL